MKHPKTCGHGEKQGRSSAEEHAEEPDPACPYLTETYQYHLPSRLIAQEPPRRREDSRMMLLSRHTGEVRHERFRHIGEQLREGDLLVVNDSKVFPARILGRKESGGRVELLLLQPADGAGSPREGIDRHGDSPLEWDCLIRAARRPRIGQRLQFPLDVAGEVFGQTGDGIWRVRFRTGGLDFLAFLDRAGLTPLPPYIKRNGSPGPPVDRVEDRRRYQTVFARAVGSVAAPTAGLHFSRGLCGALQEQGVLLVGVTLHVGQATFLPVRTEDIRDHKVWPEWFHVQEAAAETIRATRRKGCRVVAVGTTVVRCLESLFAERGEIREASGWASLTLIPGFRFRVVDALLTNFHLPGSSLLMLVSAFAGIESTRRAYAEAIRNDYRFFSYGDCMLIH